jgi:hypothetical protein
MFRSEGRDGLGIGKMYCSDRVYPNNEQKGQNGEGPHYRFSS